jgi:hypothetical protein
VLPVLMTIADRDHVPHDIRCDPAELVIEHFDPIGDPVFRPPRPSRPLGRPIDGRLPANADERLAGIEHIVVVTMENRSFDQMLGYLSHPDRTVQPDGPRTDVDGLTGNERVPLGGNVSGQPVTPRARSELDVEFRPDPRHDFYSVAEQIGADGEMDGFISSFRQLLADSDDIRINGPLDDSTRIVRFQPASAVPSYQYIARNFLVLNRYFASFPGATQPNRLCMLTGATPALLNTDLTPDVGYLEGHTLFELLDRAKVSWRYYEGDIGFIRAFKPYRVDFTRVRPLAEFLNAGGEPLPAVTFIDPDFKEAPSGQPASDDHAPTPVCSGQLLLREIMERLRSSPRAWSRTLLIITYDEHGGFYDHVAPPGTQHFATKNPTVSTNAPKVHPQAKRYGVRVPAMLVSPLVEAAAVGNNIYDHTTITRTILQRFVPSYVGLMPERVRKARHFGELLLTEPRTSIPHPRDIEEPEPECAPTAGRFSTAQSPVQYEKSRPDMGDERFQIQTLGVPIG